MVRLPAVVDGCAVVFSDVQKLGSQGAEGRVSESIARVCGLCPFFRRRWIFGLPGSRLLY